MCGRIVPGKWAKTEGAGGGGGVVGGGRDTGKIDTYV